MTEYEKSYKGHEYIDILNNCIERMKKLESIFQTDITLMKLFI